MTDELGARLKQIAYLEGDFVLRSGKRSQYYLDKYRFETRPELLGPLGERLARSVRERERGLVLVARTRPGPASGLVLYDLGTCLQSVEAPARKPRRPRKATADA